MVKIVVVDDDSTNVNLTKMLLELDGFEVDAFTDLVHARQASDASLYIIDCNLSRGQDGLDLLKEIRSGQTAVSEKTAVIMTSGDYRKENEAEEANADLFLLKPYAPNDLSQAIEKLLQNDETISE